MLITVSFMIGTVVISLVLGILARHQRTMNLEQWAIGGRSFNSIFVFLLLAGEIYTTFTFLGASGWAYGVGGATTYILAYSTCAYVLSYFLLPPIWRYAKQHKLITQSDYFATQFNSAWVGVLVSVVGIIAMLPYLQLQITGLGLIVQITSYGAINHFVAMTIGVLVIALYVSISGIYGSAWNAVLKDIVVLVVVLTVGIALPLHVGGIHRMFEQISIRKPGFLTLHKNGMTESWFISTVILTSLGFYMWPHTFGSIYTAKHERTFRRNAIVLPLYEVILLFSFFAGFAAILIVPSLKDSNTAMLEAVIKVFPSWLVGLVGAAGILTAIVPGSIILVSCATQIAENVYRPLITKTTENQIQKVALLIVWIVAGVAFYFSVNSNATIVALLLMGYNFVSQLFPATFLTLLPRRYINKYGAASGILVGIASVSYFLLENLSILWGVNTGLIALADNFVVTLMVSAIIEAYKRRISKARADNSVQSRYI